MSDFIGWAGIFGESLAEPNAKRLFFELRSKLDSQGFVFCLPISMINDSYVKKLQWLRNKAAEWKLGE